ncbi:penicillin-binding protein 2 [SAR86 cluster bacterium]|nr:penicillin-binding protein 2 [SAR86 cluster bacterium]
MKKFFSGKRDSESRKLVLYLILPIFIMFVVLLQTINLTVINGKKYETQSENNRIVSRTIYPTRGLIYDTHDKLLVENIASSQLNLVPERSSDTSKKIKEIADLLNLEKSFLLGIYEKQIKKPRYPFQPITLAKSLDDEQIALFSVSSEKFKGFSVETGLVRSVVNKQSLAHVLGYMGYSVSNDVNKSSNFISGNQVGISGIEKTYHDQLSGKVGTRIEEKDVSGKFVRVLSENNAESGKDLKLSIDLDLQNFLIPFFEGQKGALVALEPKSGLIKALISSPAYDPNIFNSSSSLAEIQSILSDHEGPLFNRATMGNYPPASTIKPILGLAALDEGIVDWNTIIQDDGEFYVEGDPRPYRGWKEDGHGKVDLEKAIVESSDVYFYSTAYDLTIKRLEPFLNKFGFGGKTNIDVEESNGLVPNEKWKLGYIGEFWFKGDSINLGIGQGYMLSTPIQISQAIAVIANRGEIIKPRLVEEIDESPTELESLGKINLKDETNWEKIEKSMIEVINSPNGTANNIKDTRYLIAGKTGTAQIKSYEDQEYEDIRENPFFRDHALFVGYAPIPDPELLILVIIENGESGSRVAAPIAKAGFDYYLTKNE